MKAVKLSRNFSSNWDLGGILKRRAAEQRWAKASCFAW
jgi:hypothetical protein